MTSPAAGLGALDLAILLAYFAVISAIALRSGHEGGSVRDFLVGERSIPWWAAMLSIIGTEVSALTFVGTPAYAYGPTGTYAYLMGSVGMVLARIAVGTWFVPAFYRSGVVSIYEFLELRFGPATRNMGVLCFLLTRCAMSGVRLYAGSIVVAFALGIDYRWAIVITAALAAVYTMAGGIHAVVWTEVLQVIVMVGGALSAALILYASLPHGWQSVLEATAGTHKFSVLDTTFSLTDATHEFSIYNALIGLTFFNLAVFGTDYDMAQRMLTASDEKRSARAVITSAVADLPLVALFLTIGVLLLAHYQAHPDPTLPAKAKEIFPHFIITRMPAGLRGLVVAGVLSVALSSFQSALNALAASFTVDVYRRHLRPAADEQHYIGVTRAATVGFALVLTGVAFGSAQIDNLLVFGLEIPSYTYPALLGVFLVGLFSDRGSERSCVAAIVVTAAFVLVGCHLSWHVAWTWNALFGALCSVVIAILGQGRGRLVTSDPSEITASGSAQAV